MKVVKKELVNDDEVSNTYTVLIFTYCLISLVVFFSALPAEIVL